MNKVILISIPLTVVFLFAFSLLSSGKDQSVHYSNNIIHKERIIMTTPSAVWKSWTTSEGIASFFAPESKIEIVKGGRYELYLAPDSPEGSKGSEDCRLLSFVPEKMISFEWGIPPKFENLRKNYQTQTWVVLLFDKIDDNQVKVTVYHLGFGEGEEWDNVYKYMDVAWDKVLTWLKSSLEGRNPQ